MKIVARIILILIALLLLVAMVEGDVLLKTQPDTKDVTNILLMVVARIMDLFLGFLIFIGIAVGLSKLWDAAEW